ncbi:hypothetical protein [Neobacillus bataviensis]|uniref:hypothetical protein n=1 Tax=Neobacillus bataviensis TaxID=220685 RepID=UPI001CC0F587|nr:hypothetical protein [Neobacillus bataviensis]
MNIPRWQKWCEKGQIPPNYKRLLHWYNYSMHHTRRTLGGWNTSYPITESRMPNSREETSRSLLTVTVAIRLKKTGISIMSTLPWTAARYAGSGPL